MRQNNWAAACAGIWLLCLAAVNAQAQTNTVVNCTETDLRAAMTGGGTVTFACDGTITLGDTIVCTNDTVLDGSGHEVTISGGGSVQVFYVAASLTLIHLTISAGRSRDGANGVWVYPAGSSAGGPGEPGGGICNVGVLTLRDCVVTGNRAGNGGLGYSGAYGSFNVSAGGAGGPGGGIYNAAVLTLSNCTVSGNSTGAGGSGGYAPPDDYVAPGGQGGFGGGIYNAGSLRLYYSTVAGNRIGPGAMAIAGGAGGGIWSGGDLTAYGCTFNGNSSGSGGQGFFSSGMQAGYGAPGGPGGAIYCTGPLALTNCTVAGNAAGQGGQGGGAELFEIPGNGGPGGDGGGIYAQGTLNLLNCTITANAAGSGGAGGIGNPNAGTAGSVGCGGGVAAESGTGGVVNTIITLNTGAAPDVWGVFLSLGHNLIGATNGSSGFPALGDLIGSTASPLNPGLGLLADNGGPTLTVALLPGSPAIDAGDTAAAPAMDQRGAARPFGAAADIGAYEFCTPILHIRPGGVSGSDIMVSGWNGQSCRLLASTNLSNWQCVATNCVGTNGTAWFHENWAAGELKRFYRAVLP